MEINPIEIILKYYSPDSLAYQLLIPHSQAVAKKALEIAKWVSHLHPDLQFIQEAAMLHDIGIFLTNYPQLWCFGEHHYICHGYLGRELLEKEWLSKHALVCERHTGMWLSIQDIEKQALPLPKRDMIPLSLEERIVSLADKFFSKDAESLTTEKSIDTIIAIHRKFWDDKIAQFEAWIEEFWL